MSDPILQPADAPLSFTPIKPEHSSPLPPQASPAAAIQCGATKTHRAAQFFFALGVVGTITTSIIVALVAKGMIKGGAWQAATWAVVGSTVAALMLSGCLEYRDRNRAKPPSDFERLETESRGYILAALEQQKAQQPLPIRPASAESPVIVTSQEDVVEYAQLQESIDSTRPIHKQTVFGTDLIATTTGIAEGTQASDMATSITDTCAGIYRERVSRSPAEQHEVSVHHALQEAYTRLSEQATATIALRIGTDLWIANTHETRTLGLSKDGTTLQLTPEKDTLTISRITLEGSGDHLIHCSSGVAKVLTSNEIGLIVYTALQQQKSLSEASQEVIQAAVNRGASQHCTVVITPL